MPSGQVAPLLQLRWQPVPPSARISAHSTTAVPVAGGAKQSHASSHPLMKQVLYSGIFEDTRQPMKPVASELPIQLQSVVSTPPISLWQLFHSPGTTGLHAFGSPLLSLLPSGPAVLSSEVIIVPVVSSVVVTDADMLTPVVGSIVVLVASPSLSPRVIVAGALTADSLSLPSSEGQARQARATRRQDRRAMLRSIARSAGAVQEAHAEPTARRFGPRGGMLPSIPMMRACSLFVALLVPACAQHKDSARIIDPVLHAEGDELRRERQPRGFKLGPYGIVRQRLARRSVTPAEEIELELHLDAPGDKRWTAKCNAKRQRPQMSAAEYAAVLDESNDAVAISCDLDDGRGAAWTFAAEGTLDENFDGKLTPKSASIVGGTLTVEVFMWRKRLERVRRHLPQPVAQVRMGKAAIAAMILARPEQAWVATDATPEFREVSLATLAALDLMPLGLEG